MEKDAAAIRQEFHSRLGAVARQLTRELYPDGFPRGTKFSELEALAGSAAELFPPRNGLMSSPWPAARPPTTGRPRPAGPGLLDHQGLRWARIAVLPHF
jgi:hypothetical protein